MQSGETPQVSDQFSGMELPDVSDMQIQLEQMVQQGVLSPEDAQAALANQSDMNNISLDPNLRKAQMDALGGLQDVSKDGLTDQDEANLSKIQNQENSAARGSREAILQNAQARGLGGSGLELMSQMKNQQDAATRTSQRDMDIAGSAQDRALQALISAGNMGGSIENQDFSQQAQKAQANDAIAKFNAQNQQQVNLANTQASNAAQGANLGMKQSIADQNVNNRNTQQQYNKQLIQQDFNNRMARNSGSAGVAQANAGAAGKDSQSRANAQNQTIGAGLSFVNPFIGAAAKKYSQDDSEGMKNGGIVTGDQPGSDSEPRMLEPGEFVVKKDDVPEMLKKMHTSDGGKFDAAGFLDSITGHRYGYKKGKK